MEKNFRDQSFGPMVIRSDTARVPVAQPDLFNPAWSGLQAVPVNEGGRQAAWFVQGDFGQGVLRHYRRGGFMARVNSHHYLWMGKDSTRSFAEFQLLAYMAQAGLPVPTPLATCYTRKGLFYTASLLIERINGAQTLANVLASGHHAAVALAVFRMHNAGVWHADLNAYNILIDNHAKVWLIDFDKSKRLALTPQHRAANLARLRRSLIKVAGKPGDLWWSRFNQAYSDLVRRQSPP